MEEGIYVGRALWTSPGLTLLKARPQHTLVVSYWLKMNFKGTVFLPMNWLWCTFYAAAASNCPLAFTHSGIVAFAVVLVNHSSVAPDWLGEVFPALPLLRPQCSICLSGSCHFCASVLASALSWWLLILEGLVRHFLAVSSFHWGVSWVVQQWVSVSS